MSDTTWADAIKVRDDAACIRDPLLQSLTRFFKDKNWLIRLTDTLRGPDRVSLRVLDWLVTNYAKKHNIVYSLHDSPFNVYTNYKDQLRGYKKSEFDPFCRRKRIPFVDSNGTTFHTTVGQLCFFRWGLSTGVIDYCLKHAAEIESDMLLKQDTRQAEQTRKDKDKSRRKELSTAAVRRVTVTKMPIVVRFSQAV